MDEVRLNQGLLDFLQASPTPFHATRQIAGALEARGYVRLQETDAWTVESGGSYYVTRNESSIIAFRMGHAPLAQAGLRMIGAHTDSPCLKVKPNPEIITGGYQQLGVEVYGGALLNPWFDRDLSLAGRVTYLDGGGEVCNALINFERPVAVIPSLAIHLDREANNNRTVNPQTDMPPLLGLGEAELEFDFRDLLAQQCAAQGVSVERVLDYDLFCYDTQPPDIIGLNSEFISSARLDNLLSCYIGAAALLDSDAELPALLVCNDHEEVGSGSAAGAQGNFLKSMLRRVCGGDENYGRAMSRSMLVSVDNAHGIHPNYRDKYDENHGPLLNQGPVIKINARQRYATNSETSALFRLICEEADVPVQSFVVRSDMACGSTIGPITAAELGVATLDLGVPTFAMHSSRELAGARDPFYLYRALQQFCNQEILAGNGWL